MKNRITILLAVFLLTLLFYSINQCVRYKTSAGISAVAINDTVQHYTNRLGTQTATIQVMQMNNNTLKGAIINKDKQLKVLTSEFDKVHSVVRYATSTQIDTVAVKYKDTVPCIFNRAGKIEDKNYSLTYNANQKGIIIDSLIIPDSVAVITGVKRKWLFSKEILVTDVTHSNPYIKVTRLQAAVVTIDVPFYKKWYVWLATGIIGGIALAK